jgi:hypothetical protein
MSQAPALPSARDGIRFAQGLVESRRLSFELEFGGQREDGLLLESDRAFSGTASLGW